jgi:ABC-type lipoprotein export system ATPase subunit
MQEIIRIEGLTKFYQIGDETIKALDGVDLSISKNEYVALMGPSGSGKSTIMNIIGCLDTPTSGNYFLNGPNVANLDDNNLAEIRNKEIGFVPDYIKQRAEDKKKKLEAKTSTSNMHPIFANALSPFGIR